MKNFEEFSTTHPLKYKNGELQTWRHWKQVGITALQENYPDFVLKKEHSSLGNTIKEFVMNELLRQSGRTY